MNLIYMIIRTSITFVFVICTCYRLQYVHCQSIVTGQITQFALYVGGTSTIVTHLYDGSIITVPQRTVPNFGLGVLTNGGSIKSIIFGYNNITNYRTEKVPPYSLCGNTDLLIKRCTVFGIGSHRVNATITNTPPRSYIINFQIVYQNMPIPIPTPTSRIPLPSPIIRPTPVSAPLRVTIPTPVLQLPGKITPTIIVPAPIKVPTPVRTPSTVPVSKPIVHMTFTLVYTGNNTDVVQLVNGMVVNITNYPNANFNIRADTTNPFIQSIQFLPNNRVETSKPWAYCGNIGILYNSCDEFTLAGTNTITARIYTGVYPQGNVLTDESITFTIVGKPSAIPSTNNMTFPILINAGGPTCVDSQNVTWNADTFYTSGSTYSTSQIEIINTEDDIIYHSERYGNFMYQIPIPIGSYSVILHFAEIFWTSVGNRVFDIMVEDSLIADIDIIQRSGSPNRALMIDKPVVVSDGYLTIQGMENIPRIDNPKLSAIEVRLIGPHYSHAVTGGPYTAVDSDGDGFAVVPVDGSESHTHGPDETLVSFVWRKGWTIIGRNEITSLTLPIGEHTITLTVTDSSGDVNTDTTTITVFPDSFPAITSISPSTGRIAGGTIVNIYGSGFRLATSVRFGTTILNSTAFTMFNATIIQVISPISGVSGPAYVSVITPSGESNSKKFTYDSTITIQFQESKLFDIEDPTAIAFGPDSKLYIGNLKGKLGKYTMNSNFDAVISSIVTTIDTDRGIHGIAFDPLDHANILNPTVYISTSNIFHNEKRNSFGDAINGKIQAVNGANLDIVSDIVTGLPVSALDHSVNGIYFGNNGELYINVGSNTNGGIPGELSRSLLMSENYFSAAVLVANLGVPAFDGFITYSAANNGNPVSGFGPNGVEVFASGLRNPFGIVMHSNGKLYATENGPNPGFGDMATGCGPGQYVPDVYDSDELNLIVRGGWYGHPNHKRGETDPRQCVWKGTAVASTSAYTAPLMKLRSSTDGIVEYDSNHFNGELRHNLIVSKYKDGLYRIVLSQDGNSVIPTSIPAIELIGDGGLAVTQAPNGNLFEARFDTNSIYVYRPNEPLSIQMVINSIYPRRGGLLGGSTLTIFGANFLGTQIVVFVGTSICSNPVVTEGNTIIRCRIPPSTSIGRKDVIVENDSGIRTTYTLAYQYIRGSP